MKKSRLPRPTTAPLIGIILCFWLLPCPILSAPFKPSDAVLLNCGGASDSVDVDKRIWKADSDSDGPSVQLSNSSSSFAAQAAKTDPSLPSEIPYSNARVFTSAGGSYTFKNLSAGRHFVRLYFYPSSYNYRKPNDSFFSVISPPYVLLDNFSPDLTTRALNLTFIVREFFLTIPISGSLTLSFVPSRATTNSFAFVNGIEVVSSPELFFSRSPDSSKIVVSQLPFTSDALETLTRLNIGGRYVVPPSDSGLFRAWFDDAPYILAAGYGVSYPMDGNVSLRYTTSVPEYIAPTDVYETARSMGGTMRVNLNYNLTWLISVDIGFRYLLRLHFCEIQSEITKENQRAFDVYINNITADAPLDVIVLAKKVVESPPYIGVPVYRDYMIFVPNVESHRRSDLWVALHPNMESKPQYADAILNGLEVFKINNSYGNLAGPNPDLPINDPFFADSPQPGGRRDSGKIMVIIGTSVGGAAAFAGIVCVCCILLLRKKKKKKAEDGAEPARRSSSPYTNGKSSAFSVVTKNSGSTEGAVNYPFQQFTFSEIMVATDNFDDALLVGVGGFGKVYKGELKNSQRVAIKRGSQLSQQGAREFRNEIELLSNLRHRHLVSLMGYCEDSSEMILVYEFMANGTLREHLYGSSNPPLSWKQRLEICIGAAKGLHYLHTGAKHTVIHRDVKTTNILLDHKWVAKVSDFGLSRNTCSTVDGEPVSTVVKGTFDPEYYCTQQITEKSDVYSFGVVLLEVLCARPALNRSGPTSEIGLAERFMRCHRKGGLVRIIDPLLTGKIAIECLNKFVETAERCLADKGVDRPSMAQVLWNLEFALSLQLSAEEANEEESKLESEKPFFVVANGDSTTDDTSFLSTEPTDNTWATSQYGAQRFTSGDGDSVTIHPSAVFSQIVDPTGR